jgi:hypothetical protein
MPSTLTSTGITFNDGTSQNSAAGAGTFPKISQTYANSGTHTFANTTKYVEFRAAGGGGGSNNQLVAGGGGGGGFAVAVIDKSNVFPNVNSITVNVGAGGNNGQVGGASSVGGYVVANGGNAGGGGTNSANGSNGGTGAVNVTALFSQTGTGGAGRGGAYNAINNSAGAAPANFGGGGGGLSGGQGTSFGGNMGKGVIPIYGASFYTSCGGTQRASQASEGLATPTGNKGIVHIIEYAE